MSAGGRLLRGNGRLCSGHSGLLERPGRGTGCQAASRQLRTQLCHELAFQHYESYSALFAFLAMAQEGGGK